jgi:hypothetical protein
MQMVTMKMDHTGLVLFWSLAEFSSRERLLAEWSRAGFNHLVPERRANFSVLKDALNEVFVGSRFLVRPLSARTGFAVVRENRGQDENSYALVLTAKVYSDEAPIYAGDVGKADEVNAAYHRHLGRVTSQQMSAALVKVLYELGGTRLRPSGSVYWLSGDRSELWNRVVAGFEAAADGGNSVGYMLRHDLDADAIVAVRDAITHEGSTEAARLSQDILSGDLGDKAIETRKREAVLLKRKVSEYEAILGVGLDHLKKTLDRVEQADATAALLLAADPFGSVPQVATHAVA